MEKLWTGRFSKQLDTDANDFNSSIRFDSRMYREDIEGSVAHATMLAGCGIISPDEADRIIAGLDGILTDVESGVLKIDPAAEDIHSFVETQLTERIGDAGKKLHTARSRNDQVALDLRLKLRGDIVRIIRLVCELNDVLLKKADESRDAVMPGYTHMQRAQPVTLAHHLLAYSMMFVRDISRLKDCYARMNFSPLGSCALAGTTYPTDRNKTAELLSFDGISMNSIDGVSDRDFCAELAACLSVIMMHLSRFSEEIILWCSWEFKFVELDDAYSTGSSIMPQKKNPDIAELVRGKTGRVYGDLTALLTMLKGIPLAYNKDMQEDKEAIFDAVDTVESSLTVFAPMVGTMRVLRENMRRAAAKGFINATDCADYLTRKGMPFRTAYKLTGEIVAWCINNDRTLESMDLSDYHKFSEMFDDDIFNAVNLDVCVSKRTSAGGTSPDNIDAQIEFVRAHNDPVI